MIHLAPKTCEGLQVFLGICDGCMLQARVKPLNVRTNNGGSSYHHQQGDLGSSYLLVSAGN